MNNSVIEPVAAEGTGTVKQAGGITMQKSYQFRTLCAKDIPLVTNVVKAIGLKEFKQCLNKDVIDGVVKMFTEPKEKEGENAEPKKVDYTVLGISFLPTILDIGEIVLNNVERCETALFKLLSSTSNLSVKEVENLSLADFAEMVIDFIKKEEFPDFFKVVLKLLKPAK